MEQFHSFDTPLPDIRYVCMIFMKLLTVHSYFLLVFTILSISQLVQCTCLQHGESSCACAGYIYIWKMCNINSVCIKFALSIARPCVNFDSDIDMNRHLTLNQSRIDEITMPEEVPTSLRLDEGFGGKTSIVTFFCTPSVCVLSVAL